MALDYLTDLKLGVWSFSAIGTAAMYSHYNSIARNLQSAPIFTVGPTLSSVLSTNPTVPYAVVTGRVLPQHNPCPNPFSIAISSKSFLLTNPETTTAASASVLITNVNAARLDFPTFGVSSWFGLRETCSSAMPLGHVITAIGQITKLNFPGGARLNSDSSTSTFPFILTSRSVQTLIKSFQNNAAFYKGLTIICGGCYFVTLYNSIGRKWLARFRLRREVPIRWVELYFDVIYNVLILELSVILVLLTKNIILA